MIGLFYLQIVVIFCVEKYEKKFFAVLFFTNIRQQFDSSLVHSPPICLLTRRTIFARE
jgi:hypothetical protein